jgi:hypothetical protein
LFCRIYPKDLVALTQFFAAWHLKEVLVVVISHVIVHPLTKSFMEIMKTVIVHLFIGAILTFLGNLVLWFSVSVGFSGEFAN